MASLVNTTVTSSSGSSIALEVNQASGSAVSLAVKGCNDIVDNILLNLLNQSGSSVFNIRNNGALYGTDGTFSGSIYLTDTNTRIVEGGSNSVRLQTNSGYVDVGPMNASYSHFQTDRSRFYFNKELIVDSGIIRSYNEDLVLDASFVSSTAKNIILRTGNVEKVRMNTDGNVGIGTDSPDNPLEVFGADTGIKISSDASDRPHLRFECGTAEKLRLSANANYGAIGDSSNTNRYMVLKDGNVGIATDAPASLLHVGSAGAAPHAAANDFVIAPSATDVGMTIRCNSNSGTGSIFFADTAGNAQGTVRYNHNTDYMSFYSSGDFFFDTGSVGIGIAAPLAKLHVEGGPVRILDVTASPSYGARLVVGRDTGQDIEFHVDDLNCKIIADQDSDSDGNHNFVLDRSFAGTGDNNFQIQKGGSSQFLINTDGNVGIGESDPDSRLHIKSLTDSNSVSGITIERSSTTQRGYINMGGGALNLNVDSGLPIKFRDGGTANVTILGTGLVGIGTESPVYTVQGNAANGGIIGVTRTTGTTTGVLGHIRFGNTNIDSDLANIEGVQDGATDSARLEFQTQATGAAAATRMTIKSTGLIGIGTDDPKSKLDIGGSFSDAATDLNATNAIAIKQASTDSRYGIYLERAGERRGYYIGMGGPVDSLTFERNNVGTKSDVMSLTRDGSVGIGTNNPTNNLVVYATGHQVNFVTETDDHSGMRVKGAAAKDKYILFNDQAKIGYQHSTATLHLCRSAAFGDNHLVINSSGSVGIGTDDPDSLLMVYKTGADSIIHVRGAANGGDARVRINGYNSSELYIDRNGAGRFAFRRTTGTDDLSLLKLNDNYTDNSTIMFWDYSSGSVGIGTNDPDYKLDLGGTTSSTDNTIRLAQNNGGTAIRIGAGGGSSDVTLLRVDGESADGNHEGATDSSEYGFSLRYMGARSGNENSLSLFTDNQTAASQVEAITVHQDGNVGIGTTNPATTLDVGGNADAFGLIGKARIGKMGYTGYAAFGHRALGDVAGKYAVLQDSNGGSYFNAASGQTVSFRIANSDQMVLSSGQLKFPDSKKIIMGTGNDMEIYHDGSHSYIKGTTTGDLYITSENDDVVIRGADDVFIYTQGGEDAIIARGNAGVDIFHDNIKKFETTGAGVTITGTATATAFSGSGASLTSLNASNLSSGTVATARLGSGTASSSTYLRGDGTWATVSGGGGSGTVTEVTVGTGLDVSNGTSTPNITLDFNELATAGTVSSTDDFVVVDGTSTRKEQMSDINLNGFNGYYGLLNTIYKNDGTAGSVTPDSNGAIYFYEGTGMQLSFSGNTITFSGTSSDYRLKKNISTFNSEAWTKVKSVNLRKFDFDEDAYKTAIASPDREITTDPKHYVDNLGFIAHELAEAEIKEAVVGDKDGVDEDGNFIYQKVNYLALVPVLWGALNEAISKIETLESKVQALEDK